MYIYLRKTQLPPPPTPPPSLQMKHFVKFKGYEIKDNEM